MIPERLIDVVALQTVARVGQGPITMEVVPAGFDDHGDCDAVRRDLRTVTEALNLCLVDRIVVEVIAGGSTGAGVTRFHAFSRDVFPPLLAERFELGRIADSASSDINSSLHPGCLSAEADNAVPARRCELERLSVELCARAGGPRIHNGRGTCHDDRLCKRPQLQHFV